MEPTPRHEWFADRERVDAAWGEVIALMAARPSLCDHLADRLLGIVEDPLAHRGDLTPPQAALRDRLAFIALGEALLRADEPT